MVGDEGVGLLPLVKLGDHHAHALRFRVPLHAPQLLLELRDNTPTPDGIQTMPRHTFTSKHGGSLGSECVCVGGGWGALACAHRDVGPGGGDDELLGLDLVGARQLRDQPLRGLEEAVREPPR